MFKKLVRVIKKLVHMFAFYAAHGALISQGKGDLFWKSNPLQIYDFVCNYFGNLSMFLKFISQTTKHLLLLYLTINSK